MLKSRYARLCPVSLPYQARQSYMHGFDLSSPVMQKGFEDYRQVVIDLCRAAGALVGKAYMTVDEKIVLAGQSQRRPKPHVDGLYLEHYRDWRHGGGGWNHSCNAVPMDRMSVIVASSATGCKAWRGDFDGIPREDGDLSHLCLGEGEVLSPHIGYILSPDCVHESLAMTEDTRRTFLRIALPEGREYVL